MNVTYAGRGGAPMARSKCTWRCRPAAQRRARVKITLQTYSVMIYHAWARLSSTPVASMGYTRLYEERWTPTSMRDGRCSVTLRPFACLHREPNGSVSRILCQDGDARNVN